MNVMKLQFQFFHLLVNMEIIGDLIFNEPEEGEISNDEYLQNIWEELHNG